MDVKTLANILILFNGYEELMNQTNKGNFENLNALGQLMMIRDGFAVWLGRTLKEDLPVEKLIAEIAQKLKIDISNGEKGSQNYYIIAKQLEIYFTVNGKN